MRNPSIRRLLACTYIAKLEMFKVKGFKLYRIECYDCCSFFFHFAH